MDLFRGKVAGKEEFGHADHPVSFVLCKIERISCRANEPV